MKKSRILALLLALCFVITAFAVPAAPQTINGAQIRLTGAPGLRFISSVSISDLEANDVIRYGTLLIPTESLDNVDDFVLGATLDGRAVADVPAINTYSISGDTLSFTAVITNIKPKNYDRAYSARSYILYNDGGEEKAIYSDVVPSRDVYSIAKKVLANESLSEDEAAFLNAVVRYVEGITVPVTFTEPVEDAQVPLSIEVEGYEATISWTRTGGAAHTGVFESGTDYTATITLTCEEGFSPNDKVTINGASVTPTFSSDYKTVTVKKTYEFKDAGYSGIY